jgi:hypothetical protein
MVSRHGLSTPVIEYLERDIAHLRSTISSLTTVMPAGSTDLSSLETEELDLKRQLATNVQQFEDLRLHAPAVPASLASTKRQIGFFHSRDADAEDDASDVNSLVESALSSRTNECQLDEIATLFEGDVLNKTRIRDSLVLIQKVNPTSAMGS